MTLTPIFLIGKWRVKAAIEVTMKKELREHKKALMSIFEMLLTMFENFFKKSHFYNIASEVSSDDYSKGAFLHK